MGRTPLVHIGSEDAADYRTKHIVDGEAGGIRYIYSVRIKPDTPVASNIVGDIDWRMPTRSNLPGESAVEGIGFQLDGVTPYVNEHEAIGSISLLANAGTLDIVERKAYKFDPEWQEWVDLDDYNDEDGDF